jgi:hypothetical protein
VKNLAAALLAAQKAMPAIHKDSNAEVVGKTKDGKPYKYSYGYLSLQGLLEAVLPVLNANGLALVQMPSVNDEGRQILRTWLYHESGEILQMNTPLMVSGNETPQAWGGAITYARRYALTALLGIAADEDDDGAAASKPAAKKAAPVNGVASEAAQKRIDAIIGELAEQRGVERQQVHDALKGALGIESMANLSAENAAKADGILAEWQKKVEAAT